MEKEFADFNDMALVCIPVEILLTAKIPAHNVVTFSAKQGVIVIQDSGMTSEEMKQCGCDCVCEECREKMTRQRGTK
ncbi:hypothetical protein [Ruminococcus sp. YE282]|uniref:hypothetical protein n=1 Tax=Ruminococcus sp. YE282 TaxID=3158780 RepID=UPI0008827A4A|nr:hypothetical protein SAMN02910441_00606 [Ruminococcus bromii]